MIVFAHRGAHKHGNHENTIPAFIEATQYTSAIELDVYRVKSGELVVIHDEPSNRDPFGSEAIIDMTYAQVQARMVPQGIEVPALFDVLVAVGSHCLINIELKTPGAGIAVAKIIASFIRHRTEEGWKETDFLVSSFNHHELLLFKEQLANIRIGALMGHLPCSLAADAAALGAYSIHPSVDFLSRALVDDAHARGLQVYVYTVNTLAEFARLKSMGVDGIFTDYPDCFKN